MSAWGVAVILRAGYAGDQWTLTFWANNVTDKEYFLYRYEESYASVGRERTAGVTLDLTL